MAISPSVLNLPFLLGQDPAGSKIWSEPIQKDFSNEIRIGYYYLNSKCTSLCAIQKLEPSICPLAARS